MPQGLQAVFALALLLPGFVSARIVRMMSQKIPQSELERVIEALIFSFFTYLVYLPIYYANWGWSLPIMWSSAKCCGMPLDTQKQFSYNGQCRDVTVHGWAILWIPVTAIVLGLAWGYVREKDLLLKGLRGLKWTDRGAYESVWADVLLNLGGHVTVGLADGKNINGWLRQYSLSDGERTLLLQDASWIMEDGATVPIPGDGLLLLTEKSEIKYIAFLDQGQKVNIPQ